MRWSKVVGKLTQSAEDWRPAELLPSTVVPGFAEAVARTAGALDERSVPQPRTPGEYDEVTFDDGMGELSPPPDTPVFPSEGPHGHRERMRDRLLDRGPDGLADYELLEMLLFLVQPRGDTKPLAKRLN